MTSVLSALLSIGALFWLCWTLAFGGIGALLARARGQPARAGFAYGALLGPVGWALVWWRFRDHANGAPMSSPSHMDWSEL